MTYMYNESKEIKLMIGRFHEQMKDHFHVIGDHWRMFADNCIYLTKSFLQGLQELQDYFQDLQCITPYCSHPKIFFEKVQLANHSVRFG